MENSPKLTVALCTHNPRAAVLRRTLDGLRRQTLPLPEWELLVIDNNSSHPVSQDHSLSWHPLGKWIGERRLGLHFARLTALKSSSSDFVVFVDDDNILRDDYLEKALEVYAKHPDVGTFGAGHIQPEFEIMPPKWLREFQGYLALRYVDQPCVHDSPINNGFRPCGAGLCIRKGVAYRYVEFSSTLKSCEYLGRRGNQLLSGEDDLFSLFAMQLGLKYGIFPELRVLHIIPKKRIDIAYFQQLVYYNAYSHSILTKHFKTSSANPHPIPSLKAIFVMLLRGRTSEAVIQLRLFQRYLIKPRIVKSIYRSRYLGWEAGLVHHYESENP